MKRVISGIILLSLLGLSVWNDPPYFFIGFAALVMGLALWEFYGLAARVGYHCYRFLGYCAAAVTLYAFSSNQFELILPMSVGLLLAMMIAALFESQDNKDFSKIMGSVASTFLGVFYVVVLAGFLVGVRVMASAPHSQLLSLFFLIIAASDTGAYYTGRNLGRHKLAPRISPGKTIEGSLGGLVAAIAIAFIVKYTFFSQLPGWHALVLAIVMNIVGQLGDLFESLLKRGAGTKDAASIIPGHGGLLDRLDSVLFNAPLLYYYSLIIS
ncbi:MAG: phosphatidate cytidylyltransferase [Acidobacteriota bacterium]